VSNRAFTGWPSISIVLIRRAIEPNLTIGLVFLCVIKLAKMRDQRTEYKGIQERARAAQDNTHSPRL
jgi:hypothetical protein